MKRTYLYLFAVVALLAACKKNNFKITDQQSVAGKALVKLGLFNMTIASTNLLIFDNGTRISGPVAAPWPYPGGGFNTSGSGSYGDYFAVEPGDHKFELYTTNPGTFNVTGKFFETTQSLMADKRYTIYTADTGANKVAITTPDDAVAPDSGYLRLRFINLIPGSAVDFYRGTTLLKSNIQYKAYTDFFDIQSGTADSFSIRNAGAPPGPALTALAYYRLALNTSQRILSFLSRGYIGAADNLRIPKVSVSVNQ